MTHQLNQHDGTGVVAAVPNIGTIVAHGTALPSAVAGYSKGCVFIKTNGSAGAQLYINEGTDTSCAFTAFTSGGTDLPLAGGTLTDGANVAVGSTTGTKVGTATSQKLAFHNSTPVIQRVGAAQAAVAATAATNSSPYGYAQAQADAIVTLVNEIRATLVEKGLMKGSA